MQLRKVCSQVADACFPVWAAIVRTGGAASPAPTPGFGGIITGCSFPSLFHLRSSKRLTLINVQHSGGRVPTEQSRETEARRHSLGCESTAGPGARGSCRPDCWEMACLGRRAGSVLNSVNSHSHQTHQSKPHAGTEGIIWSVTARLGHLGKHSLRPQRSFEILVWWQAFFPFGSIVPRM